MGKSNSKSNHQSGDTNINIADHFEQNGVSHDAHELKLWIIIILLLIQLACSLFKALKTHWQREGFQNARELSTVTIDKV